VIRKHPLNLLAMLISVTLAIGSASARAGAAADRIDPRDFLVIPLRIHVLGAPGLEEIDCQLTDADITRILTKMNRVWHQAGIHWGLESLVREPAASTERFRLARDLRGAGNLDIYNVLFPEKSLSREVVHIYLIHELPANGVWLGTAGVVKETAQLNKVSGGIDEPVPRVMAHELGHALGLAHAAKRTNLMASGTTGIALDEAEIKLARDHARAIPGAATVESLRNELRSLAKTADRARQLSTWLDAITAK
jgi:hypothetical protein